MAVKDTGVSPLTTWTVGLKFKPEDVAAFENIKQHYNSETRCYEVKVNSVSKVSVDYYKLVKNGRCLTLSRAKVSRLSSAEPRDTQYKEVRFDKGKPNDHAHEKFALKIILKQGRFSPEDVAGTLNGYLNEKSWPSVFETLVMMEDTYASDVLISLLDEANAFGTSPPQALNHLLINILRYKPRILAHVLTHQKVGTGIGAFWIGNAVIKLLHNDGFSEQFSGSELTGDPLELILKSDVPPMITALNLKSFYADMKSTNYTLKQQEYLNIMHNFLTQPRLTNKSREDILKRLKVVSPDAYYFLQQRSRFTQFKLEQLNITEEEEAQFKAEREQNAAGKGRYEATEVANTKTPTLETVIESNRAPEDFLVVETGELIYTYDINESSAHLNAYAQLINKEQLSSDSDSEPPMSATPTSSSSGELNPNISEPNSEPSTVTPNIFANRLTESTRELFPNMEDGHIPAKETSQTNTEQIISKIKDGDFVTVITRMQELNDTELNEILDVVLDSNSPITLPMLEQLITTCEKDNPSLLIKLLISNPDKLTQIIKKFPAKFQANEVLVNSLMKNNAEGMENVLKKLMQSSDNKAKALLESVVHQLVNESKYVDLLKGIITKYPKTHLQILQRLGTSKMCFIVEKYCDHLKVDMFEIINGLIKAESGQSTTIVSEFVKALHAVHPDLILSFAQSADANKVVRVVCRVITSVPKALFPMLESIKQPDNVKKILIPYCKRGPSYRAFVLNIAMAQKGSLVSETIIKVINKQYPIVLADYIQSNSQYADQIVEYIPLDELKYFLSKVKNELTSYPPGALLFHYARNVLNLPDKKDEAAKAVLEILRTVTSKSARQIIFKSMTSEGKRSCERVDSNCNDWIFKESDDQDMRLQHSESIHTQGESQGVIKMKRL